MGTGLKAEGLASGCAGGGELVLVGLAILTPKDDGLINITGEEELSGGGLPAVDNS